MPATKFLTEKKQEKQFLWNPFIVLIIIRLAMIKEVWQNPLTLTLILLFGLYKLYKSYPEPIKPPPNQTRTIEIEEIKECIVEEERLIILGANHRMYEFFWNDFSSYRIYGNTLFLVKRDRSGVVNFDEVRVGVRFFQKFFSGVLDRI